MVPSKPNIVSCRIEVDLKIRRVCIAFLCVLPAALLACSSDGDETASPPSLDGAAQPDAGATHDAASSDRDAQPSEAPSTELGGSGKLTASGAIGPSGGTPAPFTFDEPVGSRVVMKTAVVVKTNCGDVIVDHENDHLFVEVVGCAAAQTLDVTFDVPLVEGDFPTDGDAYPNTRIDVWRASGANHYVDQGAASYGSRFENRGTTMTVSNVVSRTETMDLDLHLSGTMAGSPACSQCAAGGPDITVDLTLSLVNLPTP
jgi:hypothetical protein